jgi:hypothetical protein
MNEIEEKHCEHNLNSSEAVWLPPRGKEGEQTTAEEIEGPVKLIMG